MSTKAVSLSKSGSKVKSVNCRAKDASTAKPVISQPTRLPTSVVANRPPKASKTVSTLSSNVAKSSLPKQSSGTLLYKKAEEPQEHLVSAPAPEDESKQLSENKLSSDCSDTLIPGENEKDIKKQNSCSISFPETENELSEDYWNHNRTSNDRDIYIVKSTQNTIVVTSSQNGLDNQSVGTSRCLGNKSPKNDLKKACTMKTEQSKPNNLRTASREIVSRATGNTRKTAPNSSVNKPENTLANKQTLVQNRLSMPKHSINKTKVTADSAKLTTATVISSSDVTTQHSKKSDKNAHVRNSKQTTVPLKKTLDTPNERCERCSRSRSRSSTPSAVSSSTENSPRHRPSNRNVGLASRKSSVDSNVSSKTSVKNDKAVETKKSLSSVKLHDNKVLKKPDVMSRPFTREKRIPSQTLSSPPGSSNTKRKTSKLNHSSNNEAEQTVKRTKTETQSSVSASPKIQTPKSISSTVCSAGNVSKVISKQNQYTASVNGSFHNVMKKGNNAVRKFSDPGVTISNMNRSVPRSGSLTPTFTTPKSPESLKRQVQKKAVTNKANKKDLSSPLSAVCAHSSDIKNNIFTSQSKEQSTKNNNKTTKNQMNAECRRIPTVSCQMNKEDKSRRNGIAITNARKSSVPNSSVLSERHSMSRSRSTTPGPAKEIKGPNEAKCSRDTSDVNKTETKSKPCGVKTSEHLKTHLKKEYLNSPSKTTRNAASSRKTTTKPLIVNTKKSNFPYEKDDCGKQSSRSTDKKDFKKDNTKLTRENKPFSSSSPVRLKGENLRNTNNKFKSNLGPSKVERNRLSSKYSWNKESVSTKDKSAVKATAMPQSKSENTLPNITSIITSDCLTSLDNYECCQNESNTMCENDIPVCSSKQSVCDESPSICSISQNNKLILTSGALPENIITVNAVTYANIQIHSRFVEEDASDSAVLGSAGKDAPLFCADNNKTVNSDHEECATDFSPKVIDNCLSVGSKTAQLPQEIERKTGTKILCNEETLISENGFNDAHRHVLLQCNATFITSNDSEKFCECDNLSLTNNRSEHKSSSLLNVRSCTQSLDDIQAGNQSKLSMDNEIKNITKICRMCNKTLFNRMLTDQDIAPTHPADTRGQFTYKTCDTCLNQFQYQADNVQTCTCNQQPRSEFSEKHICWKTSCIKCQNDKESEILTCSLENFKVMGSKEMPVCTGCIMAVQKPETAISEVRSASAGTGAASKVTEENQRQDSTILSSHDGMCDDSLCMTKDISKPPVTTSEDLKHKESNLYRCEAIQGNFEQHELSMDDSDINRQPELPNETCDSIFITTGNNTKITCSVDNTIKHKNIFKQSWEHDNDSKVMDQCSSEKLLGLAIPKAKENLERTDKFQQSKTLELNDTVQSSKIDNSVQDTVHLKAATFANPSCPGGDNSLLELSKEDNCENVNDQILLDISDIMHHSRDSNINMESNSACDLVPREDDQGNTAKCNTCSSKQFSKTDKSSGHSCINTETHVHRVEQGSLTDVKLNNSKDGVGLCISRDPGNFCNNNSFSNTESSFAEINDVICERYRKSVSNRHVSKLNTSSEQLCRSETDGKLPSRLLINDTPEIVEIPYDQNLTCCKSLLFSLYEHETNQCNAALLSENDQPKKTYLSSGDIGSEKNYTSTQIFKNPALELFSCETCGSNNRHHSNASECTETDMSKFRRKMHQTNSSCLLQSGDKCVAFGKHDGTCVDCISLGKECTVCRNIQSCSQANVSRDERGENFQLTEQSLLEDLETSLRTNLKQCGGGRTFQTDESINPGKVLASHDINTLSLAFEEKYDRHPPAPESRDDAHTAVGPEQDTNSGAEPVVDLSDTESLKIYNCDSYQDECCDKMSSLSDVKITTPKSSCSEVFSANSIQRCDFIERYGELKKSPSHEKHLTFFDDSDTCKTSLPTEIYFGNSGYNRDSESCTNSGINNKPLLTQAKDIKTAVLKDESFCSCVANEDFVGNNAGKENETFFTSSHCSNQAEGNSDLICSISKQEIHNELNYKSIDTEIDVSQNCEDQDHLSERLLFNDIGKAPNNSTVDLLSKEFKDGHQSNNNGAGTQDASLKDIIYDSGLLTSSLRKGKEEQSVPSDVPVETELTPNCTGLITSDIPGYLIESSDLTSSAHTQRSSVISSGSYVSDVSENFVDAEEDLETTQSLISQSNKDPPTGDVQTCHELNCTQGPVGVLETFLNEDASTETFQDAVEHLDDDYLTSLMRKTSPSTKVDNEEILSQSSSCSTSNSEYSGASLDNLSEWEDFDHDLGEIINYDKAMESTVDRTKYLKRTSNVNDTSTATRVRTSVHRTRTLLSDNAYLQAVASAGRTVKCSQIQSNVFRSKDINDGPGQQVIRSTIFKTGNGSLPPTNLDEDYGAKGGHGEGPKLQNNSHTEVNENGDKLPLTTSLSKIMNSFSSEKTINNENDYMQHSPKTITENISESDNVMKEKYSIKNSSDLETKEDHVVCRENYAVINTKIETALIKRTQRRRRRQVERQIMHLQQSEGVQSSENALPQECHITTSTSCHINVSRDNGYIENPGSQHSIHFTTACAETDKPVSIYNSVSETKPATESAKTHASEFISEYTKNEMFNNRKDENDKKTFHNDNSFTIKIEVLDTPVSDNSLIKSKNEKGCSDTALEHKNIVLEQTRFIKRDTKLDETKRNNAVDSVNSIERVHNLSSSTNTESVDDNIKNLQENEKEVLYISELGSPVISENVKCLLSTVDTDTDCQSVGKESLVGHEANLCELENSFVKINADTLDRTDTQYIDKSQSSKSELDLDDIEYIDADAESQGCEDETNLSLDEQANNSNADEITTPDISFTVSYDEETNTESVTYDVEINAEQVESQSGDSAETNNETQTNMNGSLQTDTLSHTEHDDYMSDVTCFRQTDFLTNDITNSEDSFSQDCTTDAAIDIEIRFEEKQTFDLSDQKQQESQPSATSATSQEPCDSTISSLEQAEKQDEKQTEICEESNISVARALAMEREKMFERSETTAKRDFNSSKRFGRRATIETCSLVNNSDSIESKTEAAGHSHLASPCVLRKSQSFKCERQDNVETDECENNQEEETRSRTVSDICMNFMNKTRISLQHSLEQGRPTESPKQGRKLMKWVNDNGKWMRIPINDSNENYQKPVAAPKPRHSVSNIVSKNTTTKEDTKKDMYAIETEVQKSDIIPVKAQDDFSVMNNELSAPCSRNIEMLNEQDKQHLTEATKKEVDIKILDEMDVRHIIKKSQLVTASNENILNHSNNKSQADSTYSAVQTAKSDSFHVYAADTKSAILSVTKETFETRTSTVSSVSHLMNTNVEQINLKNSSVDQESYLKCTNMPNNTNVMTSGEEVKIVGTALDYLDCGKEQQNKRQELLFGLVDSFNRRKPNRGPRYTDLSKECHEHEANQSKSPTPVCSKREENKSDIKKTNQYDESLDIPKPIPKLKAVKIQEEIFEGVCHESRPDEEYCFTMVPLKGVGINQSKPHGLQFQPVLPERARTLPIRKSKTFSGLRDIERSRMKLQDLTGTISLDENALERSSRKDSNNQKHLELPIVKKRLKSPEKIARRHKVSSWCYVLFYRKKTLHKSVTLQQHVI